MNDEKPICISCNERPATFSNEDGYYCKDCMQIHILEKLFFNIIKMKGRKNDH